MEIELPINPNAWDTVTVGYKVFEFITKSTDRIPVVIGRTADESRQNLTTAMLDENIWISRSKGESSFTSIENKIINNTK